MGFVCLPKGFISSRLLLFKKGEEGAGTKVIVNGHRKGYEK
jgi:hypothetical protein